jgi:predicted nucleic acid-binding Zn ribbon protein
MFTRAEPAAGQARETQVDTVQKAEVAEQADAADSKSVALKRRVGSTPTFGTMSAKSGHDRPLLVGALLASSRDAAARLAGVSVDREQWRQLVGERIAARTEPGPKRGRELTVFVASAAWAQELSLLVTEIVSRLKAAGVGVDTIRFRVRDVAPTLTPSPARKPSTERAPLPADLEAHLAGVGDEALRSAVADAASLWLARVEKAPVTSARPAAQAPRAAAARSARSDQTPHVAGEGRTSRRGKRRD